MPLRKGIKGDYVKEILRKHGAVAAKIRLSEVHRCEGAGDTRFAPPIRLVRPERRSRHRRAGRGTPPVD
jgi:hypothetical protein